MVSCKNFNSAGSYNSFSSASNTEDKIQKCQNRLKQVYSDIINNREMLYKIIGLNSFLIPSNTSATLLNDMNIIQRQLNFILQKIKNKLVEVEIKDRLQNHHDQIMQQKNNYLKAIDIIRKNNIVTPEIVRCAIFIEKYFDIKSSSEQLDEDEFDSLEIPTEIDQGENIRIQF